MALLHRLDRGSQYTGEHFRQLLKEHGIPCSMSRAGEAWDNSLVNGKLLQLSQDRTHVTKGVPYRPLCSLRRARLYRAHLESYADHSTLGYVTPVQLEEATKA